MAKGIDFVVIFDYKKIMPIKTRREVVWIKAAQKDFSAFPLKARQRVGRALTIVAEGAVPDIAKPLSGLGAGVWELAIKDRGDAFRVVYVFHIGNEIWVIHAFQKKSKSGIATPKHEVDLVRARIKRLKGLNR